MFSVISIDPGTRNLAACRVTYRQPPDTGDETCMEEFLARLHVEHADHRSIGSLHIPTAVVTFRYLVEGEWTWMVPPCAVVIEQQGNTRSPIVGLCYAFQGFFHGLHCTQANGSHQIYVHYPAARKFRGAWVTVAPRGGHAYDLKSRETDPVKKAAVEAMERILTHMHVSDEVVAQVVKGGQHTCDALLQAVAYVCERLEKRALPVRDALPEKRTELMLKQPREGRKRVRRSSAVVKST